MILPPLSEFERRIGQRWERVRTADADTARSALGRRLVGIDGWSIEDWLARPARSDRDEGRARGLEAAPAIDPTLSAADLLALRTQLVAKGARDG